MMPKLPDHTIVDGRIMYTKVQLKQYGLDCFDAGLNYEPELQSSPKVTKTSELSIDDLLRMFGGLK